MHMWSFNSVVIIIWPFLNGSESLPIFHCLSIPESSLQMQFYAKTLLTPHTFVPVSRQDQDLHLFMSLLFVMLNDLM
jgi:hypothetical protein